MLNCFSKDKDQVNIPIYAIALSDFNHWISEKEPIFKGWVASSQFKAEPGSFCLIPTESGSIRCVLLGIEDKNDFWSFGALPRRLPQNIYSIAADSFFSKE